MLVLTEEQVSAITAAALARMRPVIVAHLQSVGGAPALAEEAADAAVALCLEAGVHDPGLPLRVAEVCLRLGPDWVEDPELEEDARAFLDRVPPQAERVVALESLAASVPLPEPQARDAPADDVFAPLHRRT